MEKRPTKEKKSRLVQVHPSVLVMHTSPFYITSLHICHGCRHIDLQFFNSIFYMFLVCRYSCQSERVSSCY